MMLQGRRYDTGQCVEVETAKGTIVALRAIADDANLPWLAPGFIDLQVNGYGGIGFNDADLSTAKIAKVAEALALQGVATFLPTCTTDSEEVIARSCAAIAAACEALPALKQCVAGIHVEGPFISPQDGPRGAHPREQVRPPNFAEFERWQVAAKGMIRLLTLSPEYEEAAEFIARATAQGVVVAIGHTNATSEQIKAAVNAGAKLSTHLGNGAHVLLKRHPNYIWDQLAEDRLMASLIADGHHLPPAVVQCMLRAKSPERCLLISDMTNLAGCQPGSYRTSLGEVELLENGKLVVGGQREIMAGASLPLAVGIGNAMRFAGLPLKAAIELATLNPARLLGLPLPHLALGASAKLVLFRLSDAQAIEIVASSLMNDES